MLFVAICYKANKCSLQVSNPCYLCVEEKSQGILGRLSLGTTTSVFFCSCLRWSTSVSFPHPTLPQVLICSERTQWILSISTRIPLTRPGVLQARSLNCLSVVSVFALPLGRMVLESFQMVRHWVPASWKWRQPVPVLMEALI